MIDPAPLRNANEASAVYLTHHEPERITLVEADALDAEAPPGEPLACFGDRVALLQAIPICDEARQVHLTAYWRVESAVDADATVFAQCWMRRVRWWRRPSHPLPGMQPFWVWQPGEVVRDVCHFDPVPSGDYTIRLGLWELATGEEHWAAEGYADSIGLLLDQCPSSDCPTSSLARRSAR